MLKSVFNVNKSVLSKVYSTMSQTKTLQNVVAVLENFAPTCAAEKWDNVGLLIEPAKHKQRQINRILLTNDLTERVMQEALQTQTDMIVSYHPPIFAPLKRITQNHWKERIVSICLAESIAVYSPHTAWDSVTGGVNDWLASALPYTDIKPIVPDPLGPEGCLNGAGRIYKTAVSLNEAIARVQQHIGLNVHVGLGVEHTLETPIRRVAVCAGSGASLLKGVPVDLYITGEMSHHEVLEANHQNVSVILCNHSNSERGFLLSFRGKLHEMLQGECEVLVSKEDRDPLITHMCGK